MHNLKSPQNYHMIKMILAGCMNNLLKAVYFYLPRIQTNDDRQKKRISRTIVWLRIDVKIHICRLSGRFDHTVLVGKDQT